MNGAAALLTTAADDGVNICFANPGTTELGLVAALNATPSIRCVLGLFEGVCTGAADGYGRMSGRPAATLLHLGPGFANGIANLHNARRARTPVLNIIGDHATWHLPFDAPLTSDIRSLTLPVSGYHAYVASAEACREKMTEALAATVAGGIATLVVPTDVQEGRVEGTRPAPRQRCGYAPAKIDGRLVEKVAGLLSSGVPSVILIGSGALTKAGQKAAQAIMDKTGARVFAETFPAKWDRGGGIPAIARFPYFPEQGMAALRDARLVLLVGCKAPVAYFAAEGIPSELAPPGSVMTFALPGEDAEDAMVSLAAELNCPLAAENETSMPAPLDPMAAIDARSMAHAVARALPENAIVMVEGATSTPLFFAAAQSGTAHTVITNTGGAIGQGMPVATGAALACPDRKVVNLQADGSASYTLQALWTQAREQLDVVTVLCSNRAYGILRVELERANIDPRSKVAERLTSLDAPALDWVSLARGFGVPGARATTAGELAELFRKAVSLPGPFLIEAVM